jgi:hypothetical protein
VGLGGGGDEGAGRFALTRPSPSGMSRLAVMVNCLLSPVAAAPVAAVARVAPEEQQALAEVALSGQVLSRRLDPSLRKPL